MRRFAACVLLLALPGCGGHRAAATATFCGLARTVNGFDPVAVRGVGCSDALAETVRIERDVRGQWSCSRSVGGTVELDCRDGIAELELLERTPVAATRTGGVVTLANWRFRLRGAHLEGRNAGSWRLLAAGPPYCEPTVPREVLLALRLRSLTPNGGCFG